MHDAMRVDQAASLAAYRTFHRDWPTRVRQEADWLRSQASIGSSAMLPICRWPPPGQAGIPGVALCSLNWFDIATAYLADQPGMPAILRQMQEAYACADLFLQPEPSMPMPAMPGRRMIDPIAAQGENRRQALNRRLALPEGRKLVLIGFGGIGYQGRDDLPELPGVVWLLPDDWLARSGSGRNDRVPFSRCGVPFIDLLASCDLLITKVGYGSFVEAAAHAVPVLYLDRPDWPETPFLAAWLARHGNAAAIEEAALFSSRIGESLNRIWQKTGRPAPRCNGADQAARLLLPAR
jgi:hypothetical protein